MIRWHRCESDDPLDSEHIQAETEEAAAREYRALMLDEHGRAPEFVRVWCVADCCGRCYLTVRFAAPALSEDA